MLQECRPVEMYKRIRPISEGTYGMVYQAHVVGQPDKVVALKKASILLLQRLRSSYTVAALWLRDCIARSAVHDLVRVDRTLGGRFHSKQ